jgi:hypothetical protein
MNTNKFLALGAAVCALAIAPVAVGAGATATPSLTHPKVGQTVKITVRGMKPGEKVKAVETIPAIGQKRAPLYPRAGHAGTLIVSVKAQIKGKHVWKFTGRQSRRTASTHYVVR